MCLMSQRIHWRDRQLARKRTVREATARSVVRRPLPFFQTSEIYVLTIVSFISTTVSLDLVVSKHSTLVHGLASSCCCSMLTTRSCTFQLNDSTSFSATRALRAINRSSIDSADSVGKKPKQKQNAPCATWPTNCSGFMPSANLSVATRLPQTLHGSRNLKTAFLT